MLSTLQLSVADGGVQPPATEHPVEGRDIEMFEGHAVNCGGIVSIEAALQQRGPPLLLFAATTTKLP
jgi:hypothetical protein